MNEINILSESDIETLKDLVKRSGMASSIGRENLCYEIGININDLSSDNFNLVNDDIFINKLLRYLNNTGNLTALEKLYEKIELKFRGGLYENKLKSVYRQVGKFTLIQILEKDDFKTKLNKECISAYQQCLSHKKSEIGLKKTFNELLTEDIISLDQYKADFDSRFSLLDCFVSYLKIITQESYPELSQELEIWHNKYQSHVEYLMELLNNKQQEFGQIKESCLLVAIFQRNEGFKIQVWIIDDISKKSSCVPFLEEAEFSQSEFPKKFREIYQKSLQHCGYLQKIKVFLPYKLVDSNIITMVDKLVVDEQVNDYLSSTFGQEYEVAIEFSERLGTGNRYVHKWERKRIYFDAQKPRYKLASDILPFIQSDMSMSCLKNLSQELLPDDVLGRRFINKIKIEIVMEILFHMGIPFALWVREDIPEMNFEEELEEICKTSGLDTLSSIIKNKRLGARVQDDHIGNYLSLLWDVHNLRPETHTLSMS